MAIDVLIVGAGPVGLNLALCLSKLGIQYRLIDKRSGLNTTSNAIGVNPRTLEIWETLGVVDKAIERGMKLKCATWYDGGKFLSSAQFSKLKSKYKFMLALPQAQTEKLLYEQVSVLGGQVEWNKELIDLVDDNNCIVTKLANSDETIEARFVIGCDGYKSSVREISKIVRDCHDLTQHFIMIDAKLNGQISNDEMSAIVHDDGVMFFFPMKDNFRIVAEVSHDPKYSHIKIGSADIFDDILSKRFSGVSIKEVDWLSAFYVHECLAQSYVKDKVILCGDAAHTHSPAGGQGMNTGIQDTWNLSWKLAQILNKEADIKLLDTYNTERRAIGRDVLKRSGKLTAISSTNYKIVKLIRNFAIRHFMGTGKIGSKMVNSIGQTDICYSNTNLVNTKQVLQKGCIRWQLNKIKWSLFCNESVQSNIIPKYIDVTVDKTLDILKGSKFCLIRPDGYIAMYANKIDDVIEFLRSNGFSIN